MLYFLSLLVRWQLVQVLLEHCFRIRMSHRCETNSSKIKKIGYSDNLTVNKKIISLTDSISNVQRLIKYRGSSCIDNPLQLWIDNECLYLKTWALHLHPVGWIVLVYSYYRVTRNVGYICLPVNKVRGVYFFRAFCSVL